MVRADKAGRPGTPYPKSSRRESWFNLIAGALILGVSAYAGLRGFHLAFIVSVLALMMMLRCIRILRLNRRR